MARIWDRFLTERDKTVMAASGFGARPQGFGKRPALLVIDVNYAFLGDGPAPILESVRRWRNSCGEEGWEAVKLIRPLIDLCREKGVPVIYTTGMDRRPDLWDRTSANWKNGRGGENPKAAGLSEHNGNDIVAEIAPGPRDIVIRKPKPSGFFASPLLSYLVHLGCDSVIVAGTATSGCVRATVLDAYMNNFRVAVAEEACFERCEASHAMSLFDMNSKYADVTPVQAVMDFLALYPPGQFELPSGKGVGEKPSY
jgi:nicotinamidase-related amidase